MNSFYKKLIVHLLTRDDIPDADPDKKRIMTVSRIFRTFFKLAESAVFGYFAYIFGKMAYAAFDEELVEAGVILGVLALAEALFAIYFLLKSTGRLDEAERKIEDKLNFTYRKK